MLYLQYNFISKIENLSSFENLVYLDLFKNQIKVAFSVFSSFFLLIQTIENLSDLRSLRFLVMGENGLTSLKGVESLWRLEVLDVHNNSIPRIGIFSTTP